jgi:hypothetical protein
LFPEGHTSLEAAVPFALPEKVHTGDLDLDYVISSHSLFLTGVTDLWNKVQDALMVQGEGWLLTVPPSEVNTEREG